MNLWEIQAAVKEGLEAHPTLAGVPVLLDDGTYERTPGREHALKTEGVVLIVWQIASFGIPALANDGVAAHLVYVPIVIEENVERNRHGGLNLPWEKLLQSGLEALSGRKGRFEFQMYDPAWQNLGKVDGTNRVILNLLTTAYVKPLTTTGTL
ncbi:MAG TPA: hypothetical protein PKM73_10425 [Verrucomicrobiota bacterium]|nr:hypothetical protein [Verrucomicrobiota bacterium]HNU51085.1 hypothetical protein [Verrucomicrobiota bacterium]